MRVSLVLCLSLAHQPAQPPMLRAWHRVLDFRAVTHGASQRTMTLLGNPVHVHDALTVTFKSARGRRHTLNLTRSDTFPPSTVITYVRHGTRENRRPPLLPTYLERDATGNVVAAGTLRADGRVRVLVRDRPHGILVVEPEPEPGIEFPAGMARPQHSTPFAYYAHDAHLDLGGGGLHVDDAVLKLDRRIHRQSAAKAQGTTLRGRGAAEEPPSPRGVRQHRALAAFRTCPTELHRLTAGVAIDQLFVAQAGSADAALFQMAELLATVNAVYTDQVRRVFKDS